MARHHSDIDRDWDLLHRVVALCDLDPASLSAAERNELSDGVYAILTCRDGMDASLSGYLRDAFTRRYGAERDRVAAQVLAAAPGPPSGAADIWQLVALNTELDGLPSRLIDRTLASRDQPLALPAITEVALSLHGISHDTRPAARVTARMWSALADSVSHTSRDAADLFASYAACLGGDPAADGHYLPAQLALYDLTPPDPDDDPATDPDLVITPTPEQVHHTQRIASAKRAINKAARPPFWAALGRRSR